MEKNQLNPDLPPEVLFHIFVGLQPLDLCAIELVCKLWGEAVDGNVWKVGIVVILYTVLNES